MEVIFWQAGLEGFEQGGVAGLVNLLTELEAGDIETTRFTESQFDELTKALKPLSSFMGVAVGWILVIIRRQCLSF